MEKLNWKRTECGYGKLMDGIIRYHYEPKTGTDFTFRA